MPALAFQFLRRAKHLREQAERALRLSRQTTDPDVAQNLREYATKLESEAHALDEKALLAAREEPANPKKPPGHSGRPQGRSK